MNNVSKFKVGDKVKCTHYRKEWTIIGIITKIDTLSGNKYWVIPAHPEVSYWLDFEVEFLPKEFNSYSDNQLKEVLDILEV